MSSGCAVSNERKGIMPAIRRISDLKPRAIAFAIVAIEE